MSTSAEPVLIFGAAGSVGCATAIAASSHGANVWFAMRDIKKAIPGLTLASEQEGRFTRVQADLTSPASIADAVAKSGARTAFVYVLFSSEDYMESAFEALKRAGITYVVLLSAYGVYPSALETRNHDFIPKVHAETEIKLLESGIDYVAVRPAFFNTNLLQFKGYQEGRVDALGVEARNDFLAPEDIGAVAGALLAKPALRELKDGGGENSICLCGPRVMSLREAFRIVSDVLGREIQVGAVGEEEFRKHCSAFPKPLVDSMLESVSRCTPPNDVYPDGLWDRGVENIRRYAGREPTAFEDWVKANKAAFV